MSSNILEFSIRTGKIIIDLNKCEPAVQKTSNPSCGFACIKADRLYGRSVLRIENNMPVLAVPPQEAARLCNECLGCEYECEFHGSKCIEIHLPIVELDEYKKKKYK